MLEVARRKSGNYTVRRPLEIGAAMSGCSDRTISGLGRYGEAVGEAFQMRDDVLGVFGTETMTGKPAGQDLIERKATSVVIAAHQLADPATRRQLTELMTAGDLDDSAIERWRTLIVATGAVQRIEDMISDRVSSAREELDTLRIGEPLRAALVEHGRRVHGASRMKTVPGASSRVVVVGAGLAGVVRGAASGRSRP